MKFKWMLAVAGLSVLLSGGVIAKGHAHKHVKKTHQHRSHRVSAIKTDVVSINEADEKQLKKLPGIGSATAKRIVACREKNGRFKSMQDLLQVRGMSERKLQKLDKKIGV